MKTSRDIKNRISECATLFSFEYHGKQGNVDPYYLGEDKYEFLLYFNGSEKMVYDVSEVMTDPFFDGKSLTEIADEIDIDSF